MLPGVKLRDELLCITLILLCVNLLVDLQHSPLHDTLLQVSTQRNCTLFILTLLSMLQTQLQELVADGAGATATNVEYNSLHFHTGSVLAVTVLALRCVHQHFNDALDSTVHKLPLVYLIPAGQWHLKDRSREA